MSQRQMLKRSGVYQPCTGWKGCGGTGWVRGPGGRKMTHARCGGDGWIRVGTKPSGGGGRRRRSHGRLRKAGSNAASGAVVWLAAGALFGTVGFVVAGVLLGLVLVLAVHRALVAAR